MSGVCMRGAEAIISFSKLLGKKIVIKNRAPKKYRAKQLDDNLRKTRTRSEARLLHKAKLAGVQCPTVLCVDEFSLWLSFIKGKRPTLSAALAKQAGELLAKLHSADIIHGDFTGANLLVNEDNLYLIDFGLGFFSNDIEDKAVDVLTMLKSLSDEKIKSAFLEGYRKYEKSKQIFTRLVDIEKRVRYAF